MSHLPIELIIDILQYVRMSDVPVFATKHFFFLRHFLQLVIHNIPNIKSPFFLHFLTHYDIYTYDKNSMRKRRTINIHIRSVDRIPKVSLFDIYKYNCRVMKIQSCDGDGIFSSSLKTLVIKSSPFRKLTITIPDTLQKLIIPGMFLEKYPENLVYLICAHQPKQELLKLRKLGITTGNDNDCLFPSNLEVLSCYCENKIPENLPKNLKKLCLKSDKSIDVTYIPSGLKMLWVMCHVNFINPVFIETLSVFAKHNVDSFLQGISTIKLTHLAINTVIVKKRNIDMITEYFNLESLVINCQLIESIVLPPNLKTLKYINLNHSSVQSIPFSNFPQTLEYLSIEFKGTIIQPGFIIPSNLTYLKIITRNICHTSLVFPQSLVTLILDVKINNHNNYPPNLVYLDVKTDNMEHLKSIENLSQLKYLKLDENCVVDGKLLYINYPKSLRYLTKNIDVKLLYINHPKSLRYLTKNMKFEMNAHISKNIRVVTWFKSSGNYRNYGVTGIGNAGFAGVAGNAGIAGNPGIAGPVGNPGIAGPDGFAGFQ